MKLFKILSTLVLFFGLALPAAAQETLDWGTKFEIIISFDYESLGNPFYLSKNDRKLYDQYSAIDGGMIFPSWSPDGKWIAICGIFGPGIWIVPSEGGEPILIYENYQFETETAYEVFPKIETGVSFTQVPVKSLEKV